MGALSHFESHFDRYRPEVRARWREQDEPGAGLWYDLGPHLLDQALLLLGWPQTIYANLSRQRAGAQATDYFHVQLGYGKYQAILHGSCLVSGGAPRFSLHGASASYVKFGLDTQEELLKAGGVPGQAAGAMIPNPASCTARRRLSASVGRHRMGTISSITARWPAPRAVSAPIR